MKGPYVLSGCCASVGSKMAKDDQEDGERSLEALSRAVGYLCIVAAGLKDEQLVHSASFLIRLGYSRSDCAAILGTSSDTIRVTLSQAKKKSAPAKSQVKKPKGKEKGRR